MRKNPFTGIVRWLAYLWTILSALFLLYAAVSLKLQSIRDDKAYKAEKAKGYEKVCGDYTVRIVHEGEDSLDGHFLTVLRSGKPVVDKYKLPVEGSGLYEFSPKDVVIIPGKAGVFRLVLVSAVHDCDAESINHIWFFKFAGKGSLIKRIALSGLRMLSAEPLRFMGSSVVGLPYFTEFGGYETEPFIIPAEVFVGDEVRLSPMLKQSGIDALTGAFESELRRGVAVVNASSDTPKMELFLKAEKDFSLAASGYVFEY